MPERRNEVCVKRTDLQHLACKDMGAQLSSGAMLWKSFLASYVSIHISHCGQKSIQNGPTVLI